ncbi:MAG: hypothetical protein ACLGI3_04755 [Actinomycetes bacterium]
MKKRRITGIAAGCAVAVATVLGVQSAHDHRPGAVRAYETIGGAAQEADTLGTHDEAQVYQWWKKTDDSGPDQA